MADPHAVQVTMDVSWKGIREEFSNVFHYTPQQAIDTTAGWDTLADLVVAQLRPLYSPLVNFKRVRVHGPTNQGKILDVMKIVKDLTGAGTGLAGADIPPEMAVVAWVYLGRGPRGGKQILRHYFHSRQFPSGLGNVGKGSGFEALDQPNKDPYITRCNNLK